MQGIKENTSWEMHTLLNRGGPLEDRFKIFGPVTILKPGTYTKEKNPLKKIYMRAGMSFRKGLLHFKKIHFDFVFNNTIANGRLLKIFAAKKIPIVTYVHELESVIQIFSKNGEAQKTFQYSKLFLSPSNLVRENLLLNHAIPDERIFIFPYYFPGYAGQTLPDKALHRSQFLQEYKLPDHKFLLFAMGTANLRKGIDYFIEIAHLVGVPQIHFVWIGSFTDKTLEKDMRGKIAGYQLENNLTVIEDMPFDKYNLMPADIFLLPSREDPYPLVILDAAFLQIPAMAFAGTGGATEFIGKENGWLIQAFSLPTFAEKIKYLEQHKAEIHKAGQNAFEHAMQLHGNPENFMRLFQKLINQLFNE